jgi:8-amino-7-oxononanoate synthase
VSLSDAEFAATIARAGKGAARREAVRATPAEASGYDVSFETLPGYEALRIQRAFGERLGLASPYYRLHDVRAGATSRVGGRDVVNFSSYDYLGLNGDPRIVEAVSRAARDWGTSVSASRITAGERAAHRELEQALAAVYEAEDCVAFVSGHATAVSALACLLEPRDLIVHDALIHNCVIAGARMSGATRRLFAHNDLDSLEELLAAERHRYKRALIATEGLFSMDGDGPDLGRLVEIKERYGCWLLVDEAHALGTLGASGQGIFEHQGIDPARVDIWLGTLSKSLVSCGGYIAGRRGLVEYLKSLAPGFVYSVGMPVPVAVAAACALGIMQAEPHRVSRLQENSRLFAACARECGLDTGASWGTAVIPVIVGDTLRTVFLAERLLGSRLQRVSRAAAGRARANGTAALFPFGRSHPRADPRRRGSGARGARRARRCRRRGLGFAPARRLGGADGGGVGALTGAPL